MAGSELYNVWLLTVAAGAQEKLNVVGRFASCLFSNVADFKIGFDDQPTQYMAQGLTVVAEEGQLFSSVTIDNVAGAVPLTVRIAVGTGAIVDARLSIEGGLSLVKSQSVANPVWVTVDDTVPTLVLAANANRREAILRNTEDAGGTPIYVGDANVSEVARRGMILNPGETIVLTTAAAIYGLGIGGFPELSILEVLD